MNSERQLSTLFLLRAAAVAAALCLILISSSAAFADIPATSSESAAADGLKPRRPADGLKPRRPADWTEVCDSLAAWMEARNGIRTKPVLKSALRSGKKLNLHFTQSLKFYPWRKADIEWFRDTLSSFLPETFAGYELGDIYAKAQLLEQLAMPVPGNSGRPSSSQLRTRDPRNSTRPLVLRTDIPPVTKGLNGRHIALWHSHGYYYNESEERWMWQRAPLFTTVEDLYTLSYVLPFLSPMLENAGACVLLPRERDLSKVEVTGLAKDNEWNLELPRRGRYSVYVTYRTTPKSSDRARYTVYHSGGSSEVLVNQRIGGGAPVFLGFFEFDRGTARITLTNAGSDGRTVDAGSLRIGGGIGESGLPRYVEGAKYWLRYTGADSTIWDQNSGKSDYYDDFMCRGAWVNWLSCGSSLNPGKYIPPKDGEGRLPEPRDGLGIPIDLSLAFHTDAGIAGRDSTIGTLAIYTRVCDGKHEFPDGEDRMLNRMLADLVQTQITEDARALWTPEWRRREIWDKSYSESRTPQVPSMLLELLSHQNFEDMKYGLDPAFRFTVSRSVYKALLKFLSNRYGCSYVVQPLPVHAFSARLTGSSSARLSWKPTEDPLEPTAVSRKYIVYTRKDDGGFDNGTVVDSCSVDMEIEPGHLYSWKVEAMNEGGRSFPSEILAAGVPESGNTGNTVLIVNNFTRISGPAVLDDGSGCAGFNTALDGGVPYMCNPGYIGEMYEWDRSRIWKSDDNAGFGASFTDFAGTPVAGNSFDYVAGHGKSVMAAGHAFCSVSSEVFAGMEEEELWAVDLICGKQSECRTGKGERKYCVFPSALRNTVRALASKGTCFIVSGSRTGSDPSRDIFGLGKSEEELKEGELFISEVLGYELVSPRASRNGNVILNKSAWKSKESFPDISAFHVNNAPSADIYCVETMDAIVPSGRQGKTILRYADSGTSAGVFCELGTHRTVCLGFPLEAVTDEVAMDGIIRASIQFFEK